MSGFGYGIGSFMEGLANGIKMRQSMDARALDERRLQLQEDNAAFERQVKEQELDWKTKDRARADEEYQKNAPINDALRQDKLSEIDHAKKTREHTEADWNYQEEERKKNAPVLDAQRRDTLNKIERGNTEWDWKKQDREADQPIKDAERRNKLSGLDLENDAIEEKKAERKTIFDAGSEARKSYEDEKGKSILAGKDESGKETFTVDGQTFGSKAEAEAAFDTKHGSFVERYNQIAVPKIRDFYLEKGEPEKADKWIKWNSDKRVQRGQEIGGRLLQSYQVGDWDGINKHFNELVKNNDYMATDGYEIKAEPIVEEGKTVGLRGIYKSKANGSTFAQEYRNVGELGQVIEAVTNPATVFETNLAQFKAIETAKVKAAEKNLETAGHVMEKLAEQQLPQFVEFRKMLDASTDPTIRKMNPQEKDTYALSVMRRARGGATPEAPQAPPPPPARPTVPLLSR